MKRKPPVRHTVRKHKREGKVVDTFSRGKGQPQKKKSKVVGRKEALKKLLRGRLKSHLIVNLISGEKIIAVVDKTLHKEALTKRLKTGWILAKDYEKHSEAIIRWAVLREITNESKKEIRDLEKAIPDMREQIAAIESGEGVMRHHTPMLPTYKEMLRQDLEKLPVQRRKLKKVSAEYKPLNSIVKSLKNNFKTYISRLENMTIPSKPKLIAIGGY